VKKAANLSDRVVQSSAEPRLKRVV